MHAIKFKAKCPYEIGDKIHFDNTGKEMEITDIITKMSAKTGKTHLFCSWTEGIC